MVNVRQYTFHILIALFILGIFIAIVIILKQFDLNPASELPCDYFDSINITDGEHQNGDIIYKNVTYPKDQYAKVTTVLGYGKNKKGEFIKVPPYYRGCLCNRKKCVRLCCRDGCLNHDFEIDFEVELRKHKFTTLINNDFNFITESCGKLLTGFNGTKLSITNVRNRKN